MIKVISTIVLLALVFTGWRMKEHKYTYYSIALFYMIY